MRLLVTIVACAVGAACVAADGSPGPAVTFADYAAGEGLSDKGATGGGWGPLPVGATATNVCAGAVRAMDVDTSRSAQSLVFAGSVGVPADRAQFDFRVAFGVAAFDRSPSADPEACGFRLEQTPDGALALAGAANGRWHRLSAEGLTIETDRFYDLRFETCTIGGAPYVSYLVRQGEAYLRLVGERGETWFRIARTPDRALASVEVDGNGRLSDFSGGPGTADPKAAFHWIGGKSGEWSEPENWSLTEGGASCGRIPGEGDYVRVDGQVALTHGKETATVTDYVGHFAAADAPELVAGAVDTFALDTTHPRVGHELSVTEGRFFGVFPGLLERCACTWWRGSSEKTYEAVPVSKTTNYAFAPGDYCHWFKVTLDDTAGSRLMEREFYFSKLPVLYLTTDDGLTPTKEKEEHDGQVVMQSGEEQWKDKNLYSGKMTIKVRGNTTRNFAKKSWKVKLDEKWGTPDIPMSKHWVLLANYLDRSNLRNKLAGDFANEIGSLGMKSTWVECVLNGAWQGCYQLSEHVRIAGDRVDVFDWEGAGEDAADAVAAAEGFAKDDKKALEKLMSEDFGWVTDGTVAYRGRTYELARYVENFADLVADISGGYLFESSDEYDELTKFTVTSGVLKLKTMVNSPEFLFTNPAMTNWCANYIRHFCDATTSDDGYSTEGRHWSEYCDADSMATYFLVMEMFGNDDAIRKSRYFYKDRSRKMRFGPVWDFDWGVGNGVPLVNPKATGWKVHNAATSFYGEWADDPWFCTRVWTLYWKTARPAFAALLASGGAMDIASELLKEAGAADDEKWLNDPNWAARTRSDGSPYPMRRFAEDVGLLRTYLSDRLAWLDEQFASVTNLMESYNRRTTTSSPYVRGDGELPIAFANAPTNVLAWGESLRLRFGVADEGVHTVDVFANGLRVRQGLALADGLLDVEIPAAALTAEPGDPNCVSLAAYDSSRRLLGRNFALVTVTACEATQPVVDADGRVTVPAVPYAWIRAALAGSPHPEVIESETPEVFQAVVCQTPSPWGKATPLWRDYVAGTDPDPAGTNAAFVITSFAVTNGVPSLGFRPNLGSSRVYTVEGREALDTGTWTAPPSPRARFYRVRIDLP